MNLYGFVGNNGIDRWDVLGKEAVTLSGREVSWAPKKCGSFEWIIEFLVSPDRENTGIILQQVEIEGEYQKYDPYGSLLSTKYKIGPKVNPYHEVWDASRFRRADLPPKDKFGNEGTGVRTTGKLTMTGLARYYPNLSYEEKVFGTGNNANPGAGEFGQIGWTNDKSTNGTMAGDGQWAGQRNPGWLAAGATASSLYKHEISITWDCCDKEEDTILVYKIY